MTRREMGLAGMAAMVADGDTMGDMRFDPVAYSRERYKSAPLRLKFAANTSAAARAWQRKLRVKMRELVGDLPENAPALRPRVLETKDFPAYTREKIVFTSREGMEALGYLLKPKAVAGALPVMVCVPGHGRGVEDMIGIDDAGKQRTVPGGYQFDYPLQFVSRGIAAFAIEPLAFGYRRDPVNAAKSPTANSCQPAAGAALLFGETMIGWRAYDVMRSIDYIETRKDLDAKRVGCVGISGGGTCALFASALDMRIKAAMVSGYLCTFRDCILSISHCMDNYVPGILKWAEMSDIAGLIAPRSLFVESGEQDRIFPLAGFKEGYAGAKKIYDVLGAGDAIGMEIHPGGHQFSGVKGIPFIAASL